MGRAQRVGQVKHSESCCREKQKKKKPALDPWIEGKTEKLRKLSPKDTKRGKPSQKGASPKLEEKKNVQKKHPLILEERKERNRKGGARPRNPQPDTMSNTQGRPTKHSRDASKRLHRGGLEEHRKGLIEGDSIQCKLCRSGTNQELVFLKTGKGWDRLHQRKSGLSKGKNQQSGEPKAARNEQGKKGERGSKVRSPRQGWGGSSRSGAKKIGDIHTAEKGKTNPKTKRKSQTTQEKNFLGAKSGEKRLGGTDEVGRRGKQATCQEGIIVRIWLHGSRERSWGALVKLAGSELTANGDIKVLRTLLREENVRGRCRR